MRPSTGSGPSMKPTDPTAKSHPLLLFTILNLAGLLALLAVEAVVAERRWWGTFLTYMPQQVALVPSILLLLIALKKRQPLAVRGNIAILVLGCVGLLGWNLPWPGDVAPGIPVRAMTFNVKHLSAGEARVIRTIQRAQPDVVFLQEARELPALARSPRWRQAFPGWAMVKGGEVVILSRYPIRRHLAHPVIGTDRAMLEAVLDVDGTPVTAIAVHFTTAMTPRSMVTRGRSRRAYLRHTVEARRIQTAQLLAIAAHSPYPVLIAGDFNTPPKGVYYRQLTRQYRDLFRVAGWGPGYTFPTAFPVLRIDYLFAGPGIAGRQCAPVRPTASDHLPLVAELAIRRGRR
jgi:vancomycin resistance protein VanJ